MTIAGSESVEIRAIDGASALDGLYLARGKCKFYRVDSLPKTVDIKPFRFERFAEGKLLEGEYGHIWK